MKIYLYVLAIADIRMGGWIQFEHSVVTAKNKDEARLIGQGEFAAKLVDRASKIANDYVVEIGELTTA